jgi:hypothetical protein
MPRRRRKRTFGPAFHFEFDDPAAMAPFDRSGAQRAALGDAQAEAQQGEQQCVASRAIGATPVWAGQQQGEWDKTGAVSILSFANT